MLSYERRLSAFYLFIFRVQPLTNNNEIENLITGFRIEKTLPQISFEKKCDSNNTLSF